MKIWKRLLALLTASCLTLGMLTVGAFGAEGDEAQIGETSYATLADAVKNATSGEIITLLGDVTLKGTVSVNKTLALDLNGYTLTGSGNLSIAGSKNISVTIRNGSLGGSTNGLIAITGGILALENLTSAPGAAFQLKLSGGTVDLWGCDLTSSSTTYALLDIGRANVTMTNCHLTAPGSSGAVCLGRGSLEVSEGVEFVTSGKAPIFGETANVTYPVGCGLVKEGDHYVVGATCTHQWSDWTVAKSATCTEEGEETQKCTVCGATNSQKTSALGHAWGEWTVKEATCSEDGSQTHTCTMCEFTETEKILALGHQFVTDWSQDETSHWHACANCDAKADETSHTENGGVVTTEATATSDGVRTYSCTDCGRVLRTEPIPATGGGSTGDGSTGGGSTGGGSTGGGSIGGGSTGGGSIGGGSTGGGSTVTGGEGEDLNENDTPLTGDPEEGEDLDDTDTPLASKPFLFVDVGENRWFYPAIKYVFDRDLMGGIDSVTFSPFTNTSRGMLVTVLYRLDGAQERGETPNASVEFTDVPAGKWFTAPVLWASDKGMVNGYGTGAFGPNDDVTREQVAAILYRYAQYKGCDVSLRGDLSGYADSNKVAKYARDAMSWAVGVGIIGGTTGDTLDPKGNANRAQIATMLMRFDQFLTESQEKSPATQAVG